MKKKLQYRHYIVYALFFLHFSARAQPFQIVWGMNGNLAGASSSSNFSPDNAALSGAHPHSLPSVLYYSLGGGDYAYGTTYWQSSPPTQKYLDLSFAVSTYEYNISSISFRVRRSGSGPPDVAVKISPDGYSANVATFHLGSDATFYTVTVPLGLVNLSGNFGFRIYGFDASSYLGVLYFDQIVVNGTVTSIVLPVELTYFKLSKEEKNVKISWETASERNSKEFVIERSRDFGHFQPIGIVPAAVESSSRIQYEFFDEAPYDGVGYYRLRMVDADSEFGFSKIESIRMGSGPEEFSVSPNPASPFQIRILGNMINPEGLVLTDMTGREIAVTCVATEGYYLDLFPKQTLSSGLYIVSLNNNGRWQHLKVLIP